LKINEKRVKVKAVLKAIIPSPGRNAVRNVSSICRSIMEAIAHIPTVTISLIAESSNLRKRYPPIKSTELLAIRHTPKITYKSRTLDLGCGSNPRNPFGADEAWGVDIRDDLGNEIKVANLATEGIPFENDFFDFCTAFDVIEHIPRNSWANGQCRMAFIELMNEIYRVLKPGGLFLHSTPAFPSKRAFQDPTHVNIITEDTMPDYFCHPHKWARRLGYGFNGNFELVDQRWVDDSWLSGILRAIK